MTSKDRPLYAVSAESVVAARRVEAQELMAKIRFELHRTDATVTWGDAGDMSRVVASLTEALRVLTSGKG